MNKILLAGASGYLGGYVARELMKRSYAVRAVVRNPGKLRQRRIEVTQLLQAEVTRPEALMGCCHDIDVIISTVGITRQKDGLTYMDVDYQANLNLLREAQRSGVKKFIYISVLNGEKLRHLKICDAKERFAEELAASGLACCIIRPNGFFSDMTDFFRMAQKGRAYLFADGEFRVNPIHGADLAEVCVDAIDRSDREIEVGGPNTLTHNEIAALAFAALGRKPKITYIPHWIRVAALKTLKLFSGPAFYNPIEFFMTVMAMDMVAPEYGRHPLEAYFASLKQIAV